MEDSTKRKAEDGESIPNGKRQKTKRQWRVPRQSHADGQERRSIQPGDKGIWVTCNRDKERQCIGEMRDLFSEHAEALYHAALTIPDLGPTTDTSEVPSYAGIENDIQDEIAELQQPGSRQLFTPIRLDVQCVVFFRTVAPIEPVSFVKDICEAAMRTRERKRTRFAKRLSPMTLMDRASEEGLEKVAMEVLRPHFHQEPFQRRKFAIRPTIRNHNVLTRDGVIKQVASIVGPGHEVNLRDYDLLVVVEIFKNVCGVSVLDNSFERLKRYNIAEIYDPTPVGDRSKEDGPSR